MNIKIKRLTMINYFGGKSRFLDWLLPLFPPTHKNYVEPFCGSAVVFLNKKPSAIETINDLDGRLLNFMRILRERPAELIHQLDLTLYSRAEFQYAQPIAEDALEDCAKIFCASNAELRRSM
jgi:DNA adenine methylase